MNFINYIDQCKTKIRAAKPNASEEVIEWNAPFILKPSNPNQKGILLIHGLLDAPFVMREIGKAFQELGFLVYAILLPGHGTLPNDLIYVTYQDWIAEVEFGMKALKQEVTAVSIAGFSTGATLALYYAHRHSTEPLEKIYGFSPACQIKSKFACLTGLISWTGKIIPHYQFLKKYPEDDAVKYMTLAFNGAWQVYKLTWKIKNRRLSQPLFFAISEQDETVSFAGALSFFKKQTNSNNKMVVFSNRDYPVENNITAIRSDVTDKHILCLSHHGIIYSKFNMHYGENGAYTLQCKKQYNSDYYGNVFRVKKLKNGKVASRLFYNPMFHTLLALLRLKP